MPSIVSSFFGPQNGYSLRIATMSDTTSRLVDLGFELGRFERATILATPPFNTYQDTSVGTNSGSFFYRVSVE